jgi:hypothetical protein
MDDEVPCYVVFSASLLPHLFWAQIPSRTSSTYVSPSEWETKLHNHIKQQAELQFCIFCSLYFWIAKWKTKDSWMTVSISWPQSAQYFFMNGILMCYVYSPVISGSLSPCQGVSSGCG